MTRCRWRASSPKLPWTSRHFCQNSAAPAHLSIQFYTKRFFVTKSGQSAGTNSKTTCELGQLDAMEVDLQSSITGANHSTPEEGDAGFGGQCHWVWEGQQETTMSQISTWVSWVAMRSCPSMNETVVEMVSMAWQIISAWELKSCCKGFCPKDVSYPGKQIRWVLRLWKNMKGQQRTGPTWIWDVMNVTPRKWCGQQLQNQAHFPKWNRTEKHEHKSWSQSCCKCSMWKRPGLYALLLPLAHSSQKRGADFPRDSPCTQSPLWIF